jgi:hypothetical protein
MNQALYAHMNNKRKMKKKKKTKEVKIDLYIQQQDIKLFPSQLLLFG